MFDSWRKFRKSDSEKRQEELSAYLDDALTPAERRRFEQKLDQDDVLRTELRQQQMIQQVIQQLPRARAPRNFTLSPAKYGRPRPQRSNLLYPALRAATVMAAVLLVFAISADFLTNSENSAQFARSEPEAAQVLEFATESTEPVAAEAVEREIEADDAAIESAAEEAPLEEAVAEEEVAAYPSEPTVDVAKDTPEAIPTTAALVEIKPPAPEPGEAAADGAVAIATTELGGELQATAYPAAYPAESIEEPTASATSIASLPATDETRTQDTAATQNQPISSGLPLLRIAEVGLLIAVIVLAAATFALRSRL